MSVDTFSVDLIRGAAEALEASPVDIVTTQAPFFESGNIIHPIIAPQHTLGKPFKFYPIGLAVKTIDERTHRIRLVPPADKLVSTPILLPERSDFAKDLPAIGFTALQARIHEDDAGNWSFSLFGEDSAHEPRHELSMPSTWSETELIAVVTGQVLSKAAFAVSEKLNVAAEPHV